MIMIIWYVILLLWLKLKLMDGRAIAITGLASRISLFSVK